MHSGLVYTSHVQSLYALWLNPRHSCLIPDTLVLSQALCVYPDIISIHQDTRALCVIPDTLGSSQALGFLPRHSVYILAAFTRTTLL
jgi:hypothetical protein